VTSVSARGSAATTAPRPRPNASAMGGRQVLDDARPAHRHGHARAAALDGRAPRRAAEEAPNETGDSLRAIRAPRAQSTHLLRHHRAADARVAVAVPSRNAAEAAGRSSTLRARVPAAMERRPRRAATAPDRAGRTPTQHNGRAGAIDRRRGAHDRHQEANAVARHQQLRVADAVGVGHRHFDQRQLASSSTRGAVIAGCVQPSQRIESGQHRLAQQRACRSRCRGRAAAESTPQDQREHRIADRRARAASRSPPHPRRAEPRRRSARCASSSRHRVTVTRAGAQVPSASRKPTQSPRAAAKPALDRRAVAAGCGSKPSHGHGLKRRAISSVRSVRARR